VAAEQAAYCLAVREFKPDLELYGRYDEYWLDFEQRASVGLKMNLPVQRDRRRAAVNEAQAKLNRAQAEYGARVAQVRYDVLSAHERLFEARETIRLYRDEILDAAEKNVGSARAGYEAGTTNFLTFVTALRQLIMFRQKQIEAAAEYQRQLAELERAVGSPLPELLMPAR
jgi:cobalt-zinc-cadmium efflux system outer membrane protein